jgi:hypothetical protein
VINDWKLISPSASLEDTLIIVNGTKDPVRQSPVGSFVPFTRSERASKFGSDTKQKAKSKESQKSAKQANF